MYDLEQEYLDQLETIAGEIQASPNLAQYLDEEEDDFYNTLKDEFEPRIAEVYESVAAARPLQLVALEEILLDDAFEGLFLPRVLGFSVLRGEINEHHRYVRPQEHFKEVLLTIANSSNFGILKQRIGQSVQVGFALSSDIWTTNLIQEVGNKRVRNYLLSHKKEEFQVSADERRRAYGRFSRQFKTDNYQSADFPLDQTEMTLLANNVKDFILYRFNTEHDNSSLVEPLHELVTNDELSGHDELIKIAIIYAAYLEPGKDESAALTKRITAERKARPEKTSDLVLAYLIKLKENKSITFGPEEELRLGAHIDHKLDDSLSDYFDVADKIHEDDYTTQEVQEAIKVEYYKHEGLSDFNENLRLSVYGYLERYLNNLGTDEFTEFFELGKLFTTYIQLFGNQAFNQRLKMLSLAYVKRLIKVYTDKRGRDYQDIKKFVNRTFREWDFLSEKELKELFKTKRKPRKPTAE